MTKDSVFKRDVWNLLTTIPQTMMSLDENESEHRSVTQETEYQFIRSTDVYAGMMWFSIYCEILNGKKVEWHLDTWQWQQAQSPNPNHVTMKPEQFLPSGQTSMTWEHMDGHVRMLEPCQPPVTLTTNTLYNICRRQCPVNQRASP